MPYSYLVSFAAWIGIQQNPRNIKLVLFGFNCCTNIEHSFPEHSRSSRDANNQQGVVREFKAFKVCSALSL